MSTVRSWAVESAIAGLILLNPVIAFLMVIAAEMLVDLVMEVGVPAVCAVSAAVIGWVLFRKMSSDPELAHQSEPELETDETATPAQPI